MAPLGSPSVPYAPVSHPFVERLIGTIRRECLDRTFSLNPNTPAQTAGAPSPAPAKLASDAWQQHCRELFETPIAA